MERKEHGMGIGFIDKVGLDVFLKGDAPKVECCASRLLFSHVVITEQKAYCAAQKI